jgi:hypothetical protein
MTFFGFETAAKQVKPKGSKRKGRGKARFIVCSKALGRLSVQDVAELHGASPGCRAHSI